MFKINVSIDGLDSKGRIAILQEIRAKLKSKKFLIVFNEKDIVLK